MTSLFLFPIAPNELNFEKDNLKVYTKFQGFLSGCCTYEITEQKLFFFQKHIVELRHEDVDFENFDLNLNADTINIKIQENHYNDSNEETKFDTIIKLRIE